MLRVSAIFAAILLARISISFAAPTHEPAPGGEAHIDKRCTATIRSAA